VVPARSVRPECHTQLRVRLHVNMYTAKTEVIKDSCRLTQIQSGQSRTLSGQFRWVVPTTLLQDIQRGAPAGMRIQAKGAPKSAALVTPVQRRPAFVGPCVCWVTAFRPYISARYPVCSC
jgi:hypothetical protein